MRDREKRYLKAAKAVHRLLTATDARVEPSWDKLSKDDLNSITQAGRAVVDLWDALNGSRLDG